MSTLKTNNVQVGQSVTATNNFTLYQPATPDGTVRLGVGNSGATTADVITATSAGNVGIGTSSPRDVTDYVTLALNDTTGGLIDFLAAGTRVATVTGNSGNLTVGTVTAIPIVFNTNTNERARIDSSGNLLVNTTSVPSGGQRFTISGGITPATDNSFIFGNSGLRWQALYAANGTIQTSDERDKCDIVDSPLGLNFINALRPVAYKFKVGKNEVSTNEDGDQVVNAIPGKRQHFGLLAQQVRDVVGNTDFGGWILTDTTDPDSPQGLRYDEFIAPMVKAIQEQQALITSLTARIAALEAK